jgi:hypothetical protein
MVWDTHGLMGIRLVFRFTTPIEFELVYRIKEHAAVVVSDEAFSTRGERWTTDVPDTKEAYHVREIFDGKDAALCTTFPSDRNFQAYTHLRPQPRQPSGKFHSFTVFTPSYIVNITLVGYLAVIGDVLQTQAGGASVFTTQPMKRNKSAGA